MFRFTKRSSENRKFNDLFDNNHLSINLKKRTIRGGAITLISQILKFSIQTGGTFVLARLLLPEDYGLIGMAAIILNFIELFKDLGLSTATIQRPNINHEQVTNLFWINIALGIGTFGITVALAPAIAWFYDEPRLTSIIFALAAVFILGSLNVQHLALLKRQMLFKQIAIVEIASMSLGFAAAIASAWIGLGYWALVVWRLAQTSVNVVGVWIASPWCPGLPKKHAGIREMLVFGGNISGANIVNYFSRNFDNLLIGKVWGVQALGLYAMAYKLLLLPIQQINAPISNVALPTLSRLQQEPERFSRYYYRAILVLTTVGMPIVGSMFATVDVFIPLLLGPDWADVVPIFRFLAPAAFIGTFNVSMGWAFVSLNRAQEQFKFNIVSSILNVTIFLVSVRWGVTGVAAAYGLTRLPLFFGGLAYCYQNTPLDLVNLLKSISKPFIASTIAAAIVIGINYLVIAEIQLALKFTLDVIMYSFTYLLIWLATPNGRNILQEILDSFKQLKAG